MTTRSILTYFLQSQIIRVSQLKLWCNKGLQLHHQGIARSPDAPDEDSVFEHRAQAEAYALQGQLMMAIEQLHFAQKSGDGDYFEHSQVDARLRELKQRHAEEIKDKKK